MRVKTLSVNCPSCGSRVLMTGEFPFRPFCSARCKSVDFADWAMENRRIAGAELEDGENGQAVWSDPNFSESD